MPLNLPTVGVVLNRANFADVVKSFVDTLESSIASVSATANSALSTAQAKYTKPAQGIPLSDVDATARTKLLGAGPTREAGWTGKWLFTGTDTTGAVDGDLWVGDLAP